MRDRLFSAALQRLEEAPIRLVDPTSHSSPLQEMLSNPSLRKALETVPNIGEKILALLPMKGEAGAAVIAPLAAVGTLVGAQPSAEDRKRSEDSE